MKLRHRAVSFDALEQAPNNETSRKSPFVLHVAIPGDNCHPV
jgi:hypothetical protein